MDAKFEVCLGETNDVLSTHNTLRRAMEEVYRQEKSDIKEWGEPMRYSVRYSGVINSVRYHNETLYDTKFGVIAPLELRKLMYAKKTVSSSKKNSNKDIPIIKRELDL